MTPLTSLEAANNGTPLWCQPDFIEASKAAWMRAGNGELNTEAGFWAIGPQSSVTYQNLPNTNEYKKISKLKIPEMAIALIHTHPNPPYADPWPSVGDVENSNKSNLLFYTLSNRGLWLHEPGAKKPTMLRPGISWQKPCTQP